MTRETGVLKVAGAIITGMTTTQKPTTNPTPSAADMKVYAAVADHLNSWSAERVYDDCFALCSEKGRKTFLMDWDAEELAEYVRDSTNENAR